MEHDRGEERTPPKKTMKEGKGHEKNMHHLRKTDVHKETNDLPQLSKTEGLPETAQSTQQRTTCHTTVEKLHNKPIKELLTIKPWTPAYLQDLYYQRPTREELIAHMETNLWHGDTPEISAMFKTKI